MGSCKELPVGPKHLIQKLLDKLMLCPLHFGTSSSQINSLSTFVLFSPLSLTLCQQEVVFCSSALWALPAVCVQMESKVSQQTKPPSSFLQVHLLSHNISVNHSNHIRILPCLKHISGWGLFGPVSSPTLNTSPAFGHCYYIPGIVSIP